MKGARLSKNFGHQAALFAAYSCLSNKCDAVISIDADLQQDINAIPLFLAKYSSGFDVVLGVRRSRQTDGFFKKFSAQFFYKLMLAFGVELIPNHADYRLLSSRALEALLLFKEPGIFLRALCLQLGFSVAIVNFMYFLGWTESQNIPCVRCFVCALMELHHSALLRLDLCLLSGLFCSY